MATASQESGTPAGEREDTELVAAARDGDRAAFTELVKRYQRRVFSVALGVVHNPEDAMDIAQETFLKVHNKLSTFEGESAFYTWVYRITMNLSIDHIRRRKKRAEEDIDNVMHKVDTANEGALPLSGKFGDGDPTKVMADRELERKLHEALDQLPEIHRQVILLREVESLSYSDIAGVLEISKGTVMSRLHHARRKLKELLEPYLEPAGAELDATESLGDRMDGNQAKEDEA